MDKIIGLKRGSVVLKKHHKKWAGAFEDEKKILKNLLGDLVLDIQHIGSTAVPNLAAKPIIDMLLAVKSLGSVQKIRSVLENAGYTHRENGTDDRQMLFVKGSEESRTHHLHITELGSSVWKNDPGFRDYLRAHPEYANEYERLKKNLAKKYSDNRDLYTAGKKEFIQKILERI